MAGRPARVKGFYQPGKGGPEVVVGSLFLVAAAAQITGRVAQPEPPGEHQRGFHPRSAP